MKIESLVVNHSRKPFNSGNAAQDEIKEMTVASFIEDALRRPAIACICEQTHSHDDIRSLLNEAIRMGFHLDIPF